MLFSRMQNCLSYKLTILMDHLYIIALDLLVIHSLQALTYLNH